LIGQHNRAPALRRLPAAPVPRQRRGLAGDPQLNQRRFFRVLAGVRSVNSAWPWSNRPRPVPDAPTVVREPESSWWELNDVDPVVTVAVVGETDTPWSTDAVVNRLAELAVHDELLVVYGSAAGDRSGHGEVLSGLRGCLPRHNVVTLHVDEDRREGLWRQAVTLERFLDDGSLPVVVTPAAAVPDVTAEITSYLRADRVLRMSPTTTGADVFQVWRRPLANLN